MSTALSPQPSVAERHKPGAVLSRKERQGQIWTHENEPKSTFFAPAPTIQAKCEACHEDEKPAVQAKTEQPEPDSIQTKCADCEREETHAHESAPAIQKATEGNAVFTHSPNTDFSGGLTVGKPHDRFEREADQMGEQVSRMPVSDFSGLVFSQAVAPLQRDEHEEADVQAKLLPSAPTLQRKADGGLQTSGQFTNQVQASAGGGTALPESVQQGMGSAFQADFSSIRIHTDTSAVRLSNDIGAKAFTYQNNIFFNENQYNPSSTDGRFLLAHELTHTVQQGAAVQRSIQSTSTAPAIQASALDEAIDWLLGYFNPDVIPGYSLLSVIINYDVFRRKRVEMTPENLVKGLLELIPVFGFLLYNLLQEHQVITKAFNWVRGELHRLNLTTNRLKKTIEDAWEEIHLVDGIDANIAVVKKHFVALKDDVVSFAESVKNELLSMLKEALVSVLKGLAVDKIPGYSLFTKIIHYDPITGQEVPATLEEILGDFLDLIGKKQEREEMEKRGTIKKTADWLRSKLAQFLGLLTQLKSLVSHLWETFSFETLRDPMGKLNGLITEAKGFVKNVWDFATDVALTVLKFIKDALLGLLKAHANQIPGYHLLTVILEKDPVTNQPVERNAVNLIGGFIDLVAGPEKFAEIQKSGAIERMIAWLEAQIEKFQITWEGIKKLFTDIWESLQITDLINPIGAFIRVVGQFEKPIGRLVGFVVEVVKKVIYTALELMNFPFDLIDQIVAKAMQAYEDIKRDPMAFLLNLLKAVKQGFSQFFDNIGTHLLNGLVGWLTSELKQANIQPPKDFTFRSVLTFVLDVLGISMEKIWKKIGEHPKIGPQKVAKIRGMIDKLTGIWTFVKEVMEEGPGAIWKHIQSQLANLWDTVLVKVKNWIMEQIIDKMVAKLLSMLDPTGIMAVINSFIAFYRAVQSFIERLREILQVVSSFVGGVAEIARGVVTTGANFLERTMTSALPTIIGFLANQVGLRGLGSRIGEMIQSVQAVVDSGITWLINKAVEMGTSLLNSLGLGQSGKEGDVSGKGTTERNLSFGKEGHRIRIVNQGDNAEFMMASDNFTELHNQLALLRRNYIEPNEKGQGGHFAKTNQTEAQAALDTKLKAIVKKKNNVLNQVRAEPDKTKKDTIQSNGLDEVITMVEEMSEYMLNTFSDALGGATDVNMGEVIYVKAQDKGYRVIDVRMLQNGHFGFKAESLDKSDKPFFTYIDHDKTWQKVTTPKPTHMGFSGSAGTGTRLAKNIQSDIPVGGDPTHDPPGYNGKWNRRGHLVAKMFGGPGDRRNIVAMTEVANQTNAGMRSIEDQVNKELKKGSVLDYKATPDFSGKQWDTGPPVAVDVAVDEVWPNPAKNVLSKNVNNT